MASEILNIQYCLNKKKKNSYTNIKDSRQTSVSDIDLVPPVTKPFPETMLKNYNAAWRHNTTMS